MNSVIKRYIRHLFGIGGGGVAILTLLFVFLPYRSGLGLLGGYLLSFLFVASNFLVVRKLNRSGLKRFFRLFFTSVILRFILVLSCFAAVLQFLKIDQILFTVSFIISYIFLSVIEIIFINKVLEIDTKSR